MKSWRRRAGRALVDRFGGAVFGRLARTWTCEPIDTANMEDARGAGGGFLIALWHGHMLLGLPHHAHRGWTVLVSQSGDGEISNSLLRTFGYGVLRGSTSRGGARALREMRTLLHGGSVLILTPDGPRGPRHEMNPGVAWLARATGYAILPIGFGVDRAWRLRSWDRFTIPKPGARVAMVYGEPVRVPRDGGEEDLAAAGERLRNGLLAAERRGYEHLGLEAEP